ncbi:MAG: replication protein [Gemmatimonadaceae bacterium]
MADVQLEHGHVRLANRLLEAMLAADFTGGQHRLILALARLSYGWRRRTVSVTLRELAAAAGLGKDNAKATSGSFRRQLQELIQEGVIVVVSSASFGAKATYTLQKNFTQWGRFAIAEPALAARWDVRPTSADDLLEESRAPLSTAAPLPPQGQQSAPTGATPHTPSAPLGADEVPLEGQEVCPPEGRGTASKSLFDETVRQRKDSTTTATTLAVASAREEHGETTGEKPSERPAYSRLAAAINAALDMRLGPERNPIIASTAHPLVEACEEHGIPIEWAETHLFVAATNSKAVPTVAYYYRTAMVEAWERDQARLAAGQVGDLAARAAAAPRAGTFAIGSQILTRADFWKLCVDGGLCARGQNRQAIEERVSRMSQAGTVADEALFTAFVLHAKPWELTDVRYPRDRDDRIAAAIASWRPAAVAAAGAR